MQIPVIASLNGVSMGGWTRYARLIEQAGADALELNVYYIATDPDIPAAEVERMYSTCRREVRRNVAIPLAVKIGPYFSSLAAMALTLARAGADGLVLFNRFYQPDLDLENLEVVPHLVLSDFARAAPPPAVGGDPLLPHSGGFRDHERRPHRRGCPEGGDGRRQRRHDGLGAAGARRGAYPGSPRRTCSVGWKNTNTSW